MSVSSSARVPASRVLLVASFGAFLAFLDATIVNVAFPSIRDSFPEADVGALSWVLNAYNITFAALLILFGRLTDLLGRRRSFVLGVGIFTLASVLCGIAPSVELLIGARVIQAVGAAMLVPASLALVIAAFPSDRRAHAVGIWGASAAVAAGLGPPIGGVLVELWDWRAAFLVNLPFGVVAVWAARHELVESRAPGRRMVPDLLGALLLVLALAALNLGIVRSEDWGWTGPATIASFVAATVLAALFVISSRRHRAPMLDPLLLRLRSFNVGSVATVVAGLGFYAYLLTNVLWLQYVWGYSVIQTGLALVPASLIAAVVAARLGPLADKHGYRPFVVPGAIIWAAAFLWYHQVVGVEPAFWAQWLPGQILSGLGVGATLPLLGSAALAAVPGGRYATASAVVSAARQVGGVLGIAVIVVLIGELAPATIVDSLRNSWLLSVGAFLLVAVLAIPLGRTEAIDEEETAEERPAVIHWPAAPADWAVPSAAGADAGVATDLWALPMVAALPETARTRLEGAARLTQVPAGAYLMRAGDPPGSAYVVRTGRLEVTMGDTVVREVGAGQVLGELALLSGESRSASVRARRDTTLTEIPRDAFEEVLETDPVAARYVLTQVADRLRTAGGPAGPPPPQRVSVIAVVGLGADVSAAEVEAVGDVLQARLAHHLRVCSPRRPGQLSAEGLARAELDHDRVLLVAAGGHAPAAGSSDETAWREFCVRQADSVVFVARSQDALPSDPLSPAPSRRPEIVLLGAAPGPQSRADWVAATDGWQLTLVEAEPAASPGLRALADRLAARSLGLVLAGGGARAFTHVGVLRELEDQGIHVDRVAGASVGAIISSIHALGVDGATLEEICYAEFVRRRPFSDYRLPSQSLARGNRVKAAMERTYGRENVIEGLARQLSVVSVDLVSRTRQVHRRGRVVDAALASSRLPVLFAPLPKDDGRLLLDGGVLDNMPTDLLVERDEGPVVAVSIGSGGDGRARSGRPRVPALGDTLMRTMMIGSAGAVESARSRGAWVVSPSSMGVGLLEFHQFDRMVQSGRAAARQLLAESNGDLFAAPSGDEPGIDGVVMPDARHSAASA